MATDNKDTDNHICLNPIYSFYKNAGIEFDTAPKPPKQSSVIDGVDYDTALIRRFVRKKKRERDAR